MKKRIPAIIIMLILAAISVGCGSKKDTSVSDIQKRGVLRVAVPDKDSAFLYRDADGNYIGTEKEIVDTIAGALGVGVQYITEKPDVFTDKLDTGEADMAIGSIVFDSTRHGRDLSSVVYGGDYLYVVTERGIYVGNLDVFEKKSVGISNAVPGVTRSPIYSVSDVEVIDYNNLNSAKTALDNMEIAAYFCYRQEAEQLIANGRYQVQNISEIGREDYVILTPGSSVELMNGINVLVEQYLSQVPTENDAEAAAESGGSDKGADETLNGSADSIAQ